MLAGSNVEHRQDQNFTGMQSNLNMDSDWNMIDTPISNLPPTGPLASGVIAAPDQHQSSSSCQKNINVDGTDHRDPDNEDQSYITKAGSRGSVRPRTGMKRDRYWNTILLVLTIPCKWIKMTKMSSCHCVQLARDTFVSTTCSGLCHLDPCTYWNTNPVNPWLHVISCIIMTITMLCPLDLFTKDMFVSTICFGPCHLDPCLPLMTCIETPTHSILGSKFDSLHRY